MFGRWFGGKRTSEFHPWLEDIAGLIEGFGLRPHREGGALRLATGPAVTTVRFRQVRHTASDGMRVSGIFEVHSELGASFPATIGNPATLAAFNTSAALGAALPALDALPFHVRSRVTCYEGDDGARRVYCSLLAASALTNASILARSIAEGMGVSGVLQPEPMRQTGPSRWTKDDFAKAADVIEKMGTIANASPTGLVTEFPWDVGSVSSVLASGRTALLELESEVEHPALGAGLFTKLTLPLNLSAADAVRLATDLNRLEADAIDAPPFFGAWCVQRSDVYFVSFFPDFLRHPHLLATVASWMGARVAIAKDFVEARG